MDIQFIVPSLVQQRNFIFNILILGQGIKTLNNVDFCEALML